nr:hypothetical protein [Micromonospora sp. DSM 115978]
MADETTSRLSDEEGVEPAVRQRLRGRFHVSAAEFASKASVQHLDPVGAPERLDDRVGDRANLVVLFDHFDGQRQVGYLGLVGMKPCQFDGRRNVV